MPELILVDLESIKENPNAGRTSTIVMGEWSAYCKIDIYPPDILILPPGCMAISERYINDGILYPHIQYEISIGNHSAYEILKRNKNVTEIEMNRGANVYMHATEPKWIYHHENTPVKCSNCLQLIPVGKVIIETIDCGSKYGDEEIQITICPLCDQRDTLDYEYEPIDEALLRMSYSK